MRLKSLFGPSTLVAAAFIGPGTLTTCTLLGVQTGFEMLWVMLFSIVATIVLQEMAARLGFATQQGLGEALNQQFPKGLTRWLVFFLVIGAILIGNAAYEAGNIAGGVLGLDLLLGEHELWPILIGGCCFALMLFGEYKWVERLLIALVVLMSLCFLATAILVKPNITEVFSGFIPSVPASNRDWLLAMAIIGTTIVPYNLFLHASTISKKWSTQSSIAEVRLENAIAIVLGGFISILIIITAGSSAKMVGEVTSAKDLAMQLEPLFGQAATWCMGVGLMAAGISSALTAPLAAAYAAKGLFGWAEAEQHPKFRAVWMGILLIGILVAVTDVERILVIKFAQITNALLLPFIALFLVRLANAKKMMGKHANGVLSNILAGLVILITILLSIKSLSSVFAS